MRRASSITVAEISGHAGSGLIGIVVTVIGYVVLSSTRYGRRVIAVGSNLEAARRVGMPAKWILASVYLVAGVASAIAGLLIAARLGSGSSNAAVGLSLGGGSRGSRWHLADGRARHHPRHSACTMTIAVIGNGLILMHISPFFTQIVTGAIILAAHLAEHPDLHTNFRFGGKKKA